MLSFNEYKKELIEKEGKIDYKTLSLGYKNYSDNIQKKKYKYISYHDWLKSFNQISK